MVTKLDRLDRSLPDARGIEELSKRNIKLSLGGTMVTVQDVESAEGSDDADGRWWIARRVAEDRVISVVDPEAGHAHMARSVLRDRYKVQVVGEPETWIYASGEVTRAFGEGSNDASVGIKLLAFAPSIPAAGEADPRAEPIQVLGDSANGSGIMSKARVAAERRARQRGVAPVT